jgi:hypothetical protein
VDVCALPDFETTTSASLAWSHLSIVSTKRRQKISACSGRLTGLLVLPRVRVDVDLFRFAVDVQVVAELAAFALLAVPGLVIASVQCKNPHEAWCTLKYWQTMDFGSTLKVRLQSEHAAGETHPEWHFLWRLSEYCTLSGAAQQRTETDARQPPCAGAPRWPWLPCRPPAASPWRVPPWTCRAWTPAGTTAGSPSAPCHCNRITPLSNRLATGRTPSCSKQ